MLYLRSWLWVEPERLMKPSLPVVKNIIEINILDKMRQPLKMRHPSTWKKKYTWIYCLFGLIWRSEKRFMHFCPKASNTHTTSNYRKLMWHSNRFQLIFLVLVKQVPLSYLTNTGRSRLHSELPHLQLLHYWVNPQILFCRPYNSYDKY